MSVYSMCLFYLFVVTLSKERERGPEIFQSPTDSYLILLNYFLNRTQIQTYKEEYSNWS